jgi:hypothetical protein
MGARFRLRGDFDMAGYRPDTQVVLRAMQHYGLMLADNGSNWFFQGTAENGWDDGFISDLKRIPASAFEAVDESSLMIDPNSGQYRGGVAGPGPGGGGAGTPAAKTTPRATAPRAATPTVTAAPTAAIDTTTVSPTSTTEAATTTSEGPPGTAVALGSPARRGGGSADWPPWVAGGLVLAAAGSILRFGVKLDRAV